MLPLLKRPVINDVTTDTAQPPSLAGANPPPYPPQFAAKQKAAYPEIQPLAIKLSPDKAFALVAAAARAMEGWEDLEVDGKARMITGIAVTKTFRFKDDFVIVVQGSGAEALVQMRSRSRLGKGDLGANAQRILDFLATVSARVVKA